MPWHDLLSREMGVDRLDEGKATGATKPDTTPGVVKDITARRTHPMQRVVITRTMLDQCKREVELYVTESLLSRVHMNEGKTQKKFI